MALNKHIDQITEVDLQALITNKEAERKIIEYKQSLPSNTHDDKREFLADVSSFANASGGDIVYGMKADAGIATELCSLQITNVDGEKLRLENMLRSGISPRIPGIAIVRLFYSTNRRTWKPEKRCFGGRKLSQSIKVKQSWALSSFLTPNWKVKP